MKDMQEVALTILGGLFVLGWYTGTQWRPNWIMLSVVFITVFVTGVAVGNYLYIAELWEGTEENATD